MKIHLDFSGLEETLKALEECATDQELRETNKRIIKRGAPIVKESMSKKVPVSADNRKSGKKTHRPPNGHARDNIPISRIRGTGTKVEADVGWDTDDNSPYFYAKFVQYGTFKMPPRDFLTPTVRETEDKIEKIAEEEYGKLLDKLEGR